MPEMKPWDLIGELYTRTHGGLIAHLRRHNRINRSDAEDVAHDAYVLLAKAMERYGVSSPTGLLYRIADARVATFCRLRDREVPVGLDPYGAVGRIPYVDVDHDVAPAVNDTVSGLSLDDARAFILTELRGCSQREASELLGVPQQTICDRANRVARALREAL